MSSRIRRLAVAALIATCCAHAAAPAKNKAPANSPSAQAPGPKQKTPAEREARRAELLAIIEQEQKTIDRYERQSGFSKKPDPFWVTEQAYKAAKARRDAAQKQRDALANHS